MKQAIPFVLTLALAACSSTGTGDPSLPLAPWNGPPLPAGAVPEVFLDQWSSAANRPQCALVAFADLGDGNADATARSANFSGGWAVAYDRPGLPGVDQAGRSCADCGRGAFGIAGTGTTPDTTYDWENWKHFRDGSKVGYGLEGGTGPRHLAYVTIEGQGCLYNVWSFAGQDHLEYLIDQIRYVR